MSNEKTSDFLRYFQQSGECGALIVARERYDQALSAASDGGYCVTELYETAIAVLEGGKSVALRVDGELSKELYDLVRQYNHLILVTIRSLRVSTTHSTLERLQRSQKH